MKSGTFILIIFLFSQLYLDAQIETDSSGNISVTEKQDLFKPHFQVNLGSSLTFIPSVGSAMSFFATPSLTVPLSRRFFVEAGIIASNTFLPGNFPFESYTAPGSIGNLAIYGSTVYQVSPNLTIYGTGIKQLVKSPLPVLYSPIPQNSFTVGSSFKIGKGITIGASVHMSDGYNFYSPIHYRSGFPGREPFMW